MPNNKIIPEMENSELPLIAQNIQRAMNILGITETELQKETGVPMTTVHRICSGQTPEPRSPSIQPIAKYLDLSVAQLRGESLVNWAAYIKKVQSIQLNAEIEKEGTNVIPLENHPLKLSTADDAVRIPIYNVDVSAGDGFYAPNVEMVTDYLQIEPQWFSDATGGIKPHDKLLIARAVGDSMKPTILDGELFVLDYSDMREIDGVFCLRVKDEVMIKRLSFNPDEMVDVISDNSQGYPPKRWRRQDFTIIGRVLTRLRGERF